MALLFTGFYIAFLVSMGIHGKQVEKEAQGAHGFPETVLIDASASKPKPEYYKPTHLDKRL